MKTEDGTLLVEKKADERIRSESEYFEGFLYIDEDRGEFAIVVFEREMELIG